MVVQNPPAIGEMAVVAIKCVGEPHHIVVQRAGNHNDLKRRTGLHHVGDGPVAEGVGG